MRAKNCFRCGVEKPLSEFYAHKQMADGHLGKCKSCTRSDVRVTRASRPEYYRAYDRSRATLPHRAEKTKRIVEAWKRAHPQRRAAQVALGNAVRDGKVIPWPVCAIHDCSAKPEAHHPDYSAPLEVVWLCSAHHKQAHALIREAA